MKLGGTNNISIDTPLWLICGISTLIITLIRRQSRWKCPKQVKVTHLYLEVEYITRRVSPPPRMSRICGRCILSCEGKCRSWGPADPPAQTSRWKVKCYKDYPNSCLYLISFCKCNYFQSECKEGTIKESVHKKHLACKVHVWAILFKCDLLAVL